MKSSRKSYQNWLQFIFVVKVVALANMKILSATSKHRSLLLRLWHMDFDWYKCDSYSVCML